MSCLWGKRLCKIPNPRINTDCFICFECIFRRGLYPLIHNEVNFWQKSSPFLNFFYETSHNMQKLIKNKNHKGILYIAMHWDPSQVSNSQTEHFATSAFNECFEIHTIYIFRSRKQLGSHQIDSNFYIPRSITDS